MKRVVVIGSGGAGKSTFSRKLGEVTGLEVIHLDQIFWKPNWQPTPSEEWERMVSELVERDSWIMDGNFGGTRAMRIAAADTAIFLDISRWICLFRVLKRLTKYRKTNRPDMAEGCHEKVDPEFLGWIWNYPHKSRRRLFTEMEQFPEKRLIILRSARETEDFLNGAAIDADKNGHGSHP